jgi:hypothetical protein
VKRAKFLSQSNSQCRGWDYETIVGFSYEIAKFGFGILGQKGFFDIFVVKFDLSKEEIEIKPRIRGKVSFKHSTFPEKWNSQFERANFFCQN